jgi:hypothetical protein
MGSADDFNDTQPRRSLHEAKIIASQREKSTSTMVKDKTTKTIQKKKISATDNGETPSS